MRNQEFIDINYSKEEEWFQFAPLSFLKIYTTSVEGVRVAHGKYTLSEYAEYYSPQHGIFVFIKPEVGSEQNLDNRPQVENVEVGDVAIIPAYVNRWQAIQQDICEIFCITFEPKILAHVAYESVNPNQVELLPTIAQGDRLIYGICMALKQELEANYSCNSRYIETLINTLLIHLLKHYTINKPKSSEETDGLSSVRIKHILSYINDHLTEKLRLEEMAHELGMSHYYFCHLFKQSMGISPYQYVIQQRVQKAMQLLKQKREISIADIALQCGFANQSHLTRHFRQHTGMTPKIYSNS